MSGLSTVHYHELKIKPDWYARLLRGEKTHEVRRHDRDFQVSDRIAFRHADTGEGLSHAWEITHVLPLSHVPGLNVPGWCVLSLRRVDLFAERAS